MTVKVTIFEAKTHLSALLKKAQQGQTVIITSGREKKPVARLEPIKPAPVPAKKRLGVMETPGFVIPDSFWEPLPPGWSGEDE
jgi:prevent-host-death family protein